MDVEIVQGRMDDLSRAMLAKGLRNPEPMFWIEAHVAPRVFMRWGVWGEPDYRAETIRNPNHYEAIADAFALIESLPSAEEAKRQQFMASLAKVIDLGRENGIEVDHLNPLAETMKRLSENAITYQPKTALPETSWSEPKTDAEIAMQPNDIFDEIFGPAMPPERPDPDFEDFDDGNITE